MSLIYLSKITYPENSRISPQYAEHFAMDHVIRFTRNLDLSKVTINTKILTPKHEVLGVIHWNERSK